MPDEDDATATTLEAPMGAVPRQRARVPWWALALLGVLAALATAFFGTWWLLQPGGWLHRQ
jgi:type VI protein secretion system component VasF